MALSATKTLMLIFSGAGGGRGVGDGGCVVYLKIDVLFTYFKHSSYPPFLAEVASLWI